MSESGEVRWRAENLALCCLHPALFILLIWCLVPNYVHSECDKKIESEFQPITGNISSPNWPRPYNNSLACIYKLVAQPGQRVQIKFIEFALEGVPPRCTHDYIDVYTQVPSPYADLLDIPLHGRYCGENLEHLPHLLISMDSVLILGFYSDDNNADKGFLVTYTFINASAYAVGTPAPPDMCGQTVYSRNLARGELLSPTYPGVYPDNIFCYYKLLGEPGQRIRFTFLKLDLYSGGSHCPYDYVRVYDGRTNNKSNVIRTYCGKMEDVSVYSTKHFLLIEFVTKSGRPVPTKPDYVPYYKTHDTMIQRQGFKAEFEFSDRLVSLNFIKSMANAEHITGTECDLRVLSMGESSGSIFSPNWPNLYPMNVTCHYFIDGLVNRQHLEKVRLTFTFLQIPIIHDGTNCDNGFIEVFTHGQDPQFEGPDETICGFEQTPYEIQTSDPRLLLNFSTHGVYPGKGFMANYTFVTDYAIPGTPASEAECRFIYRASSRLEGVFNSPRHPSNYPSNTSCIYEFYGEEGHVIRMSFEDFNILQTPNCSEDRIEIFSEELLPGGQVRQKSKGFYCGALAPGPFYSETSRVRVVFRSGAHGLHVGFKMHYEFLEKLPPNQRCFYNLSAGHLGGGGLIPSPNYPHKYMIDKTCEWHVFTKQPNAQILLQFKTFTIEGSSEEGDAGCSNAVLKIYLDDTQVPTKWFCGSTKPSQILSVNRHIGIKFIATDQAVGAKGFEIVWTEILNAVESGDELICPSSNMFLCKTSKLCISKSLQCNGHSDCGDDDKTDEDESCSRSYHDQSVLNIILGIVAALVFLVFLVVCILHRRRKHQKKRNKKEIEVRYATRSAIGNCRLSPNDYTVHENLLQERTEKVSIV